MVIEQELPFKIKRQGRPEIVFTKTKSNVLWGVNRGNKVYIMKKDMPKWGIEHEVAHWQLNNLKPKTFGEYIEGEIQVNLLTYTRIGHPKGLKGQFNYWLAEGERVAPQIWTKYSEELEKADTIQSIIDKKVKKYWKYFSAQWQADYKAFYDELEHYRKTIVKEMPSYKKLDIVLPNLHPKRALVVRKRLSRGLPPSQALKGIK